LQRRPPLGSRPVSIVLALLSAASYGVADFLGGTASRRLHALVVTLIAMVSGSVVIVVVCLAVGGVLTGRDVAWSAAAGVAGALALATFYSALAKGPMGVVAPLSAVTSAVVPVLVGLALGERPSTVSTVGVVLALPAIALVARERRLPGEPKRVAPSTVMRALAAGIGFGGYLVLLSRTSAASELWPVLVGRGASIAVLVALAATFGVLRRSGPSTEEVDGGEHGVAKSVRLAATGGIFDAGGNVFYLLAVRADLLAVVAALQALYPAATVALAGAVDGERPQRVQAIGMVMAVLAVALVSVG